MNSYLFYCVFNILFDGLLFMRTGESADSSHGKMFQSWKKMWKKELNSAAFTMEFWQTEFLSEFRFPILRFREFKKRQMNWRKYVQSWNSAAFSIEFWKEFRWSRKTKNKFKRNSEVGKMIQSWRKLKIEFSCFFYEIPLSSAKPIWNSDGFKNSWKFEMQDLEFVKPRGLVTSAILFLWTFWFYL